MMRSSQLRTVALVAITNVLVSCATTPKTAPSAERGQPVIGTVSSRNQFVICVGCDVTPTPKTLAVAPPATNITPTSSVSSLAVSVSTTTARQPALNQAHQAFESGVHPTDLVVRFERGSAVVSHSTLSAINNLSPALSVPHILHLVASTDGVGSRQINRELAAARAHAVAALLLPPVNNIGTARSLRKQLKITTKPAAARGLDPDARAVLIQIEVL